MTLNFYHSKSEEEGQITAFHKLTDSHWIPRDKAFFTFIRTLICHVRAGEGRDERKATGALKGSVYNCETICAKIAVSVLSQTNLCGPVELDLRTEYK